MNKAIEAIIQIANIILIYLDTKYSHCEKQYQIMHKIVYDPAVVTSGLTMVHC